MTFLGHLGGPWGTMGDIFGSLGWSLKDTLKLVLQAGSADRTLEAVGRSCW